MRRSLLYTPGNNERMLRKAPFTGADVIIIDLEDSVPPSEKDNARSVVENLLRDQSYLDSLKNVRELYTRVNNPASLDFYKDILLLSKLDVVKCIVIPKAEGDLSFIYRALGKEIIALVETARGLLRVEDIARSEGVVGLAYGSADLALDMRGSREAYERNVYVKTLIAITAKNYGLDAIDKVYFKVDDIEGFKAEALEAKALGYTGKQVIHPSQVPLANEIFKPTREEIEWAKEVVKAYEEALRQGRGAIRLKGELVDHVHYRIAKRILELVGE